MGEHDDIEELFDEGDEDEQPTPSYRLTICNRRVMLTHWAPWLARNGPNTNFLRERDKEGVAIADLTLLGEDDKELAVRFYSDGGDRTKAEKTLLGWASAVGYRRVWLPDRLQELDPAPEQIGTAHVRCPSCGVTWRDSSPEFWLTVREAGAFPHWCYVCGCELPQWRVIRRRNRRPSAGDSGSPGPGRPADTRAKDRQREG